MFKSKKNIHFLHIRKTAGTQIGHIAKQFNKINSGIRIIKHPHHVKLIDLPNEDYFFSIREPVKRFVSGFYSRKRMGKPRLFVPYSHHEALAFSQFEHANDLAEALYDENLKINDLAFSAINAISHCNSNQLDWFKKCGYFLNLRPPIAIIRQEHFKSDIDGLGNFLGFDLWQFVSNDEIATHENNYKNVPSLSSKAVDNLLRWYAQDEAFYKVCENWLVRDLV